MDAYEQAARVLFSIDWPDHDWSSTSLIEQARYSARVDALLAARLTEPCPECGETGTWIEGDGNDLLNIASCPCEPCGGSGTVDQGPLVLLAPLQVGERPPHPYVGECPNPNYNTPADPCYCQPRVAVYVERERNE